MQEEEEAYYGNWRSPKGRGNFSRGTYNYRGPSIVIEDEASSVVNLIVSLDLTPVKQDQQKRGILLITMVKYHNA